MRVYKFLLIHILSTLIACSSHQSKEITAQNPGADLLNTADFWKLISPETGLTCELSLSFSDSNKMQMNFRGELFEGYYKIDSVLTHYVSINIFRKKGWDTECPVNPEYLTLYDSDTQFSYSIVDNKLYFQKAEKAIVFERIVNQNI